MKKKVLVISGINLFQAGPLLILQGAINCLRHYTNEYEIVLLIHKASLLKNTEGMVVKAFPNSRRSWFFRVFYEYCYFFFLSKKLRPFFWLSLHDMSPILSSTDQAVYCHNASPFKKTNLKELFIEPKQFLFNIFYIYLYRINIHRNKYVIVQQDWMRKEFIKRFKFEKEKVIVALPFEKSEIEEKHLEKAELKDSKEVMFFYPSFPRRFKNFEVICNAVALINKKFANKFRIVLTIDGSENSYSKQIYNKYKYLKEIQFIGRISHDEVYDYYRRSDCLVFPSKLESWGLPISEFKSFNKPMIISNLPYAKETVGKYALVKFFNPDNAAQLCNMFEELLSGKILYEGNAAIEYDFPVADSWNGLFDILLSGNNIK